MATALGAATIRLMVDPQGAQNEIRALDRSIENVEKARKDLKQDRREDEREEKRQVEKKKRDIQEKARRFSLPPLTAVDVLGSAVQTAALPLGPAGAVAAEKAKLAAKLAQTFGPGVAGAITGGGTKVGGETFDPLTAAVTNAINEITDKINDLDSQLKALMPAFEQVLQISKAQLLASGEIDSEGLGSLVSHEFKIQQAQIRLRRSIRDETLRELGQSGSAQVAEVLKKVLKVW